MSDGEATDTRQRTSVGVVAPETDAERIVEAITDAGGVADAGSSEVAAESDAVVAVGDDALSDLAATGVSAPILPVDVNGIDSVPSAGVRTAIERFLAGECEIRHQPLVRVETGADSGHALFDVTLSSAEPATISEFAVDTIAETGRDSADGPVARFRADGVVVATPAGSRGYARAAGGPVIIPRSDVAAVVPIAPFSTGPDHWILPLSGLSLTVERDEVDVELAVDGRPLCTVEPDSTVRLARDGALRIAVVADSGRE